MKHLLFTILGLSLGLIIGYFVWNKKTEEVYQLTANLTMEKSEIDSLRKNYMKHLPYLNPLEQDTSFSRYITFDKDVFIKMGKTLSYTSNLIKGVRCFFIRYDKRYSNGPVGEFSIPGMKYPEQNSIVFVPVGIDGKAIYDLWNKKTFTGGYNHGAICPSDCEEGD